MSVPLAWQCLSSVTCMRQGRNPHTQHTAIIPYDVQCTVRLTSRPPAAATWLRRSPCARHCRPPRCAPSVPSPHPRSPGWAAAASAAADGGPSRRWACRRPRRRLQLPTTHGASSEPWRVDAIDCQSAQVVCGVAGPSVSQSNQRSNGRRRSRLDATTMADRDRTAPTQQARADGRTGDGRASPMPICHVVCVMC